MSLFTCNKMTDVQEFLVIFSEFFMLVLISLYFAIESLKTCKNNDHTCSISVLRLAVSLGSNLNARLGGHGFKQLP